MISERDAHGRRGKSDQQEHSLEPIQPKMPKVHRESCDRDQQRDDEEKACGPINSMERDS